jgi:tetratricopeptide (TPR) repeat protein
MSGIVQGYDLFFEHWLYVPSIGAILVISYGLTKLKEQYPKIVPGALATIIIILIALTLQQNQVWQNQYTLYANTLQYEEGTDRVHNNIALHYMKNKDFEKAKYHLNKAMAYNNRNVHVHYNLGRIYYAEGNLSNALEYFTNSVQINPKFAAGHRMLAKIYHEKGNVEPSKLHLDLSLTPEY